MNVRTASTIVGGIGVIGGAAVLGDVLVHDDSTNPTSQQRAARQLGALGGGLALGMGGMIALEGVTGRFFQGAPKLHDRIGVTAATLGLTAGIVATILDD